MVWYLAICLALIAPWLLAMIWMQAEIERMQSKEE